MEIEPVKKEAITEVAKLYVKVYSEFLPNEGWTFETAKKFITYNYKQQPDLFFVAKEENKIIGFSFGYIKPWAESQMKILKWKN